MPLFLFVLVVVFLELSLFFEEQFLEHPAPLKISRDLKQCPVVLNVLHYDETFHKKPPKAAAALSLTKVDLELSVYAEGDYHALVFPCRRDGSGWRDVSANRKMPLQPTHWRLWHHKR